MAFHLRGAVLPDGAVRNLWILGDRITFDRPSGAADTLTDGGFLLPGLVDVHTHPGAATNDEPSSTRTSSPSRSPPTATRVSRPCASRDCVTFTETFGHPGWERPRVSRSTLRFLGPGALTEFLAGAGFAVPGQFGDWGWGPLTPTAPEIITVARPDRY